MKEEYYSYLDELRASGVTNMFGAGQYLMEAFNLSKIEARMVLMAWMEQFNKTKQSSTTTSKG
jgi:hypothetical protein